MFYPAYMPHCIDDQAKVLPSSSLYANAYANNFVTALKSNVNNHSSYNNHNANAARPSLIYQSPPPPPPSATLLSSSNGYCSIDAVNYYGTPPITKKAKRSTTVKGVRKRVASQTQLMKIKVPYVLECF